MGLNSFWFLVQFALLMLLMLFVQTFGGKRWKNTKSKIQLLLLLMYSYYFIGSINYKYVMCVIFATIITYFGGILIDFYRNDNNIFKSRLIMITGCVLLVFFLSYFKYTNFFIKNINDICGANIVYLKIILPLGISFYTFSALSYLIDVYRGSVDCEKNVVDFALYMSFFPKITAGPIVRWSDFKPQIKEFRGIQRASFNDGIQIFVFGLFKKSVLADRLGVFVDDVFRAPGAFNTGTVVLSAISYSLQIYLDFSGYSDMAIGLAKIVGFDFAPNFNLPYLSKSYSEFWKRWHISLSQWFRDYIYIPLGGNRKGKSRTCINTLIVMTLSGLWHGAGWTFVIWGVLHGLASCANVITFREKNRSEGEDRLHSIVNMLFTFVSVTLLWTVFRAENMSDLYEYWKSMFTIHRGISQPYAWSFVSLACVIISTFIAFLLSNKKHALAKAIDGFYPIFDLSKVYAQIVFFTFCGITILMSYYGNTAFIYGGF